jgi:hypothetical protein
MVKQSIRTPTRSHTKQPPQAPIDPLSVEPNVLRDSVRKALSLLGEEEHSSVRDRLLTGLKRARVNIGQCMLLLGIPARTVDELTGPEMATLIRYVRISDPKAIDMLIAPLSELLTVLNVRGKDVRRAA